MKIGLRSKKTGKTFWLTEELMNVQKLSDKNETQRTAHDMFENYGAIFWTEKLKRADGKVMGAIYGTTAYLPETSIIIEDNADEKVIDGAESIKKLLGTNPYMVVGDYIVEPKLGSIRITMKVLD